MENHRLLMKWARECTEHILPLIEGEVDVRLLYALSVAKEWEMGNVPAGVAIKASLGAHEAARNEENPVHKAIARSVGQMVATAHMADHSLGGAFYALKAIKLAKQDIETEKDWQVKKLNELPPEIVTMVRDMWVLKDFDSRI